MKIAIIGLGVQGYKRIRYLKNDHIVTVDPYNLKADYKNIKKVPLEDFQAAFICAPDDQKFELALYCLKNKKHVLVEKPLLIKKDSNLKILDRVAKKNKVTLYTAYNHRFEPNFIKMKNLIASKKLGKIYLCRMFYGNGTAKLVKNSYWRNKGAGVLPDLGSHLLDTSKFLFEGNLGKFKIISANKFENSSYDHVIIGNYNCNLKIELEMTLCMWKNHFTCDVLAEKGSAHIESLCKWGPSKFIFRKRVLPSGFPIEKIHLEKKGDPTWDIEHKYFKKIIKSKKETDLSNDFWISSEIKKLTNYNNK